MTTRYLNNRGFSLIELLIVLLISAIILTAVLQFFVQSRITYNVQEEVAVMQQNVRAAKMFLERDIRMAGSGVANLFGPNDDSGDPPILALQFENNAGANASDVLTIIYDNPEGNPCGELTAPATQLCTDLPPLTLSTKLNKTNNAAVAEVEEDNATISLWSNKSCSCNGTVYGPGDPIPIIVSQPDKSKSSILVATDFLNSQKIHNNKINKADRIPGYEKLYEYIGEATTEAIENKVLNEFEPGSAVRFFSSPKVVYFVENNNGISTLKRDTGSGGEVVAEDIEDFQCAVILEDGNEIINPDNLTAAQVAEVRRVRINILGRSVHPHVQGGAFAGQREKLEDHDPGPADNYRRRLLTLTVKVRNFGLNP